MSSPCPSVFAGVFSLTLSVCCRTQRFLSGPFSPGLDISSRVLVVSNDGRLLFSGGHWDCSLRVTQLARVKQLGRIVRHIGETLGQSGRGSDTWGTTPLQWVGYLELLNIIGMSATLCVYRQTTILFCWYWLSF